MFAAPMNKIYAGVFQAISEIRWRIFGRESASTLEIAVMHYVDRMTLDEVAREVGLSVSGVRKRLRALRARLPLEEGATS